MEIYYPKKSSAVIKFAANELKKYLQKMTDTPFNFRSYLSFPKVNEPSIFIKDPQALNYDPLEDEIMIDQEDGSCVISGSNPRSILFAVYALLEKMGARWIAPGRNGEFLPKTDIKNLFQINIHQKASYRHRGICIEGAPSLEHALGIVDWMTKKKMNTLFLQFKTSIYFWQNWYSHSYNEKYRKRETIDESKSIELDNRVINEIKKRGLIFHRVGHGWTAEAIGLKGLGWYKYDGEISSEQKSLMAEVNGERGLWGGIPINTELCYSNPKAFGAVVKNVISYAEQHPEVDCLHFWLSDAANNCCECSNCRKLTQSDHYIRLVKAVSKKLKEKKLLNTRIVFLCYFNTLSAPTVEDLGTEYDNVIFMFAPISRCYQHPLKDNNCESGAKSEGWELNKIQPPHSNREFIEILKNWQKKYSGDSFIFDYYLWRPFHDYLNTFALSKVISQDIKDYADLGLNGLVSCQVLRCFYPVGLEMSVMAETLWNKEAKWSDIVQCQLESTFGNNSNKVKEYLSGLEQLLMPENNPHVGALRSSSEDRISKLIEFLEVWEPEVNIIYSSASNDIQKRFAYNLLHYNRLLYYRAQSIINKMIGNKEEEKFFLDESLKFLKQTESKTHKYLDTWLELHSLGSL
ncbi:MAG: DUF4838 domain-containing protein [bacterium]